jgi:hypothetical protein
MFIGEDGEIINTSYYYVWTWFTVVSWSSKLTHKHEKMGQYKMRDHLKSTTNQE